MHISNLVALAIPAVVLSAAIPQDPPIPNWDGGLNEINIVGGVDAAQGDFPFIVALLVTNYLTGKKEVGFCGGVLLNANTVLTAAHCATEFLAEDFAVRAGSLTLSSGGVVANASSVTVHPKYNPGRLYNDAAIIKLATAIPKSSTISYAVLPESGSDPAAGLNTTVAGWGQIGTNQTGSETLLKVDIPVVSRDSCSSTWDTIEGAGTVHTSMFCAGFATGGKDSCNGDSGGPIINTSTKVLLGIVSWGDKNCAAPDRPGVYTNLGEVGVRSFITANL